MEKRILNGLTFTHYTPYEARSTGVENHTASRIPSSGSWTPVTPSNDLLFSLSSSFIDRDPSYPYRGYSIKVAFAAKGASEPKGRWSLSYYDGGNWVIGKTIEFDPSVMGTDIYTATIF